MVREALMETLAWVEMAFGVVIVVALVRMEHQSRSLREQSYKLRQLLDRRGR